MIVILCALRQSERGRLIMFQAYGFVLILNFIELIAMSIVYLGVFDIVKDLCVEFEENPPQAEVFQFKTVAECDYNLKMMLIAMIVTGSLVYFPLKLHFTLVLRSFWKRKRDQNEMQALNELHKQMRLAEQKRQ